MHLLADAIAHTTPYRFALSHHALGPDACAALAALFDEDVAWARHDASFYACFLAVVTDRVDPALLAALPPRVGALLGIPLTDAVHVTIQRMEPGDHALVHTDRPLAGYEAARVVVQLNPDWHDDDGGLLEVHASADGSEVIAALPPRLDAAFAFAMTPASHHAVTPAHRPRRSAVFNFWHAGNTEATARHVAALFEGVRFDALPRALDAVMIEAEARLPEATTERAGLVALAMVRWGYDDATVGRAYLRALDMGTQAGWPLGDDAPAEEDVALALAAWVTELRLDHFDLDRWAALSTRFATLDGAAWPRLTPTWSHTFPTSALNDRSRGAATR